MCWGKWTSGKTVLGTADYRKNEMISEKIDKNIKLHEGLVRLNLGKKAFSTFFLILELFQTYFLNILNAPFSDLSWKTEICRPEDLRGVAFIICPYFCG